MNEHAREPVGAAPDAGAAPRRLKEFIGDLNFRDWLRGVRHGLRQPLESGEHKYAVQQLRRLWSPAAGLVLPGLLLVALLLVRAGNGNAVNPLPPVTLLPQETPPPPLDPIRPVQTVVPVRAVRPDETPGPVEGPQAAMPGPPGPPGRADIAGGTEFAPNPGPRDSVNFVPNRITMPGIWSERVAASKGDLFGKGGKGGPGGGGGADRETEGAVYRALRWLKKNQSADGSWPQHKAAMTGFALLTYLAHGETPESAEFGDTVEKAIQWLLDNRDSEGGWPRRYEHAIATYAMCEAYGMTKMVILREAAEKAVDILIKGQNAKGGWRYTLTPQDESDVTVMGWCAQALKAAKIAGLSNPGLDAALKKAVDGFKANFQEAGEKGGFGYTSPGMGGLTGAGVLCLQLLGESGSREVRKGLYFLDDATFNWEGGGFCNVNYYWYYITQAKFQAGGQRWTDWNKLFAPTLVKRQTVVRDAVQGPDGKPKDIGYWAMPAALSGQSDGEVMNTCLCALQLEVFYRNLPTYRPAEVIEAKAGTGEGDAVQVRVQ